MLDKDKRLQFSGSIKCSADAASLEDEKLMVLKKNGWQSEILVDPISANPGTGIAKDFKFDNLTKSLEFINQLTVIANKMSHHPGLMNQGKACKVTLITHATNGLTDFDYKLALKIDELEDSLNNVKLPSGWVLDKKLSAISKNYTFSNFTKAVNFGNEVLNMASDDFKNMVRLDIGWGVCKIVLTDNFGFAHEIEKIHYQLGVAVGHRSKL